MKRIFLFAIVVFLMQIAVGQGLKPYLGGVSEFSSLKQAKTKVLNAVNQTNLKVVGEYQPADDSKRWVFVYTNPNLEKAVSSKKGLRGFGLTQRIAITQQDNGVFISATSPKYWGAAYFQDDFDEVASEFNQLATQLNSVFSKVGSTAAPFGSKEGVELDDLKDYQYMFGMPYFDDVVEIKTFDNHQAAISTIDKNLNANAFQKRVYKYQLPNSELVLYGVELDGETGENQFLPIIDISENKHTCFLPYELLVDGKEVYMLHGKFRIALSFPDLTMGTFTKIMSTPGDIEEAMENLVK